MSCENKEREMLAWKQMLGPNIFLMLDVQRFQRYKNRFSARLMMMMMFTVTETIVSQALIFDISKLMLPSFLIPVIVSCEPASLISPFRAP